ncbi:SDR family NAD(P)-dependent oxidoreductase [Lacticaseibacillus pabuli]|uniref:SDR family NAD(P)-dependent oxidoreductase n=1 Tax=Lacticaseibacillus pabuli TaxID=3025672 RepID=A0ABY7WT38_9LACO|nr:SDR family NAD(P)-dependent oxidoreductase [Lacticaseibacillus sp. KACC 23028]WDF82916.1 SDR family NAD(P)-dependent oxidoreductase [Lacticaseibacillus sp. KACC 23028]
MSNSESIVVVTGASSGLGRATASSLASMGYHVIAGVLNIDEARAINESHIEPFVLDITKDADIQHLAHRLANDERHRPLRALVNNAGIEFNAPFELLKVSEWRKQFDVNLFGQVSLTQALLPALRASKGTIVNITSVGGKLAMANYSAYAATKFAFEAMSDSLRREVKAQGIKVVVVEPGGIQTKMAGYSGDLSLNFAKKMSPEYQKLYGDMVHGAVASQSNFLKHAMTAEKAGAKVASVAVSNRPRTRYALGSDAHMSIPMARWVPTRLLDWALAMSRRNA